jgi:hypothetical protein
MWFVDSQVSKARPGHPIIYGWSDVGRQAFISNSLEFARIEYVVVDLFPLLADYGLIT